MVLIRSFTSTAQASATEKASSEELDLISYPRILIVGGGLAGLTVAKVLEDVGYQSQLVERKNTFGSEGAGIALPANATWALEQLDIDYKDKARHIKRMHFTDEKGTILSDEDIIEIHAQGAQFYSISRTSLHEILKKYLKYTQINMGMTVKGFKEEASGVRVFFSDLTEACYDLVIAADGANSGIRHLCEPNYQLCPLGLHVWRTIISTPEDLQYPTYMLGDDRVFLLYPMNENKTYIYAHKVESELSLDHHETALNDMTGLFRDFGGYVPAVLQDLVEKNQPISSHFLYTSPTIKWHHHERILFVGDAAHTFSPMLQNGGAQAFEDAYILKELLREKRTFSELLSAFAERRNERVTWVKNASDQKIIALSKQQAEERNQKIRQEGAPNIKGFKILMKEKPY